MGMGTNGKTRITRKSETGEPGNPGQFGSGGTSADNRAMVASRFGAERDSRPADDPQGFSVPVLSSVGHLAPPNEWAEQGIPPGDIQMWVDRGFTPATAAHNLKARPDRPEMMRQEDHQTRQYISAGVPERKASSWVHSDVSPIMAAAWADDSRPVTVAIAASRQGMTPVEHDKWVAAIDPPTFNTGSSDLSPSEAATVSSEIALQQEELARAGYHEWPERGFTPEEAQVWSSGRYPVNSRTASDLRALGISSDEHNRALDAKPYKPGFVSGKSAAAARNIGLAEHVKLVNSQS